MSSEPPAPPPAGSTPARRFRVRPEHLHSAAAAKAREATALELAGAAPRAAARALKEVEAAGSTASPPSTPRSVPELVTSDWHEEEEDAEWRRHPQTTVADTTASQSTLANQMQPHATAASASASASSSSVALDIADAKDDDEDEEDLESEMPLPLPPPKVQCMVCGAELSSSVAEQQIHINRCLDLLSNPAPAPPAAAAATPARASSAAASSSSSSSSSSSRARSQQPAAAASASASARRGGRGVAPSNDDVLLDFDDIYEHGHDDADAEAEERKEWMAPSRSAAAASARARARAAAGSVAASSSAARAASSSSSAASSSSSPRTVRLHFDDTPPGPAMESFADLGSSSSSSAAASMDRPDASAAEAEFRALLVAAAAHQRAHANQQREFFVVDCCIKPLPLSEEARAAALAQWTAAPAVSTSAPALLASDAPVAPAAAAAASSSSVSSPPPPPPPAAAVADDASSSSSSLPPATAAPAADPVSASSSSSTAPAAAAAASLDDGFSLGPGLGSLPLHPPLPVERNENAAAASAAAVTAAAASTPLPWVELCIIPMPCASAAASAAAAGGGSDLSLFNPPLSFRQIGGGGVGGGGHGHLRLFQPSAAEKRAHQRRLNALPPLPPTAAQRTTLTHSRLNAAWSRLGSGDRLSRLPDVLFQLVCHYLPPTEVALASSVSQRWALALNSKQLWRYLCARSYSKPQARMDSKTYYRYRLSEERQRSRAYDAIPSLSAWSLENARWLRLKSSITALNSGSVGLLHCACYLVFLILLLMKLGRFFPRSDQTTSTENQSDPSRDWTWARVFAPVWLSHGLYLLSLVSFVLMALSSPFWRALGPDQMGACAWTFLHVSRSALAARRKRATQLTQTMGAEQAALQVQRENGGRPAWDTRAPLGAVLRVAFGFVLPAQLASVLAVVKLDRSIACACEDQLILWRHIVAPMLLPFVCVLALLIMAQRDLYAQAALDRRREHMQLLDQLGLAPGGADWVAMMEGLESQGGSACRRRCCCSCLPRQMPDKILFVWMLELTGFIVTAVLVAYTTDVSRDWTINGPSAERIQRSFWFQTRHLGWWVFAPMWLSHGLSALWIQWRFLVQQRHQVYWGRNCCVRLARGLGYFVANIVWNILIRLPLLTTEILYALNLSAEWGSARGGRFPSSTDADEGGSSGGDPLSPRAGDAQAFDGYSARINAAWVALPLVLVLATMILCVYCPISILEIDKRREERERIRNPR